MLSKFPGEKITTFVRRGGADLIKAAGGTPLMQGPRVHQAPYG